MCGIAAIFSFDERHDLVSQIQRMAGALKHRGPDDEGYLFTNTDTGNYVAAGGGDTPKEVLSSNYPYSPKSVVGGLADQGRFNLALSNRRLAVIDVSPAGHQPMCNEDGSIWAVHNGEIYNYREIRQDLLRRGHRFSSNSDTEVILHSYEEWGEDCVRHFNGMWAFVVWDPAKRSLFASRDRFGIKPFYYCINDNRFICASEIKAILEAGVRPEENPEAIADYFAFLYVIGKKTFLKDIFQLEPGQNLRCRGDGKIEIDTYWRISPETREEGSADTVEKLRWLLEDSVRLRLRSDVPVGCYLSGGLDSSSVASLAALESDSSIMAFTAAFEEGGIYDESGYARDVVKKSGLIGRELRPDINGFWEELPKVIWHLDQPFEAPQVYPKYVVAKLAAKEVKVCLGGQGGDEMFVGYPRYLMAFLEEKMFSSLGSGEFGAWWRLTPFRSKIRFCRDYLRKKDLQDHFLHFAAVNGESQWKGLFSDSFLRRLNGYSPFQSYRESFSAQADDLAALQVYEIGTFLQGLLHVEDRVSMAWGLESRLPLLDHRLAEFMFGLTPEIRTGGFQLKGLMRNAVKDWLPDSVCRRRDKLGFPTPFRHWAGGPLRERIEGLLDKSYLLKKEIVNPSALRKLLGRKILSDMEGLTLWAMVSTEIWERVFVEKDEGC